MNFVFPGDLIGLQGTLMDEMQHSVETLSPVLLCVFERSRLDELYRRFPSLAYDITWMAAREEQILDENLLNVGRRSAIERAAYVISYLFARARVVGLTEGARLRFPITQLLLADTLGLSVVHTNRTLKRLTEKKLIRWRDRSCEILDEERLMQLAAMGRAGGGEAALYLSRPKRPSRRPGSRFRAAAGARTAPVANRRRPCATCRGRAGSRRAPRAECRRRAPTWNAEGKAGTSSPRSHRQRRPPA